MSPASGTASTGHGGRSSATTSATDLRASRRQSNAISTPIDLYPQRSRAAPGRRLDPPLILLPPLQQRLRRGGGADFGAVDEVEEDVASLRRPAFRPLGPVVEGVGVVTGGLVLGAAAQPEVQEIGGRFGEFRVVRIVDPGQRDAVLAQEVGEGGRIKAAVAGFDDVAQPPSVDLARQELEERRQIGGVELLGRRELPEDRPELVTQVEKAACKEPRH